MSGRSRLVLVHGFTQTGSSWEPVAARLRRRYDVVTPDAPGHGERAGSPAGLWESADVLAAEAGAGVWVGYSMGGRLALHVALAHPTLVHGVVLISTTAGIDDRAEQAARRASDAALADRAEAIGIDAFLDEWLAQALLAGAPPDLPARSRDVVGLARSLRSTGTGIQEPLWDRLGEITAPALVVVGERDAKFLAFGTRLAGALPDAELTVLAEAGHTCHLEQPDAFIAALEDWLGRHPDSASPSDNSPP